MLYMENSTMELIFTLHRAVLYFFHIETRIKEGFYHESP
jgi:hypothetical protein